MNRSPFYPDPPHINAGFYFDQISPREAFALVSRRVIAMGAEPTGDLEIIRSPVFPQFEMISDLAGKLEVMHINLRKREQHQLWDRLINGQEINLYPIRAGFKDRRVGTVVLAFQSIPASELTHPIEIVLSGALISMPAEASLKKNERRQAQATANFLVDTFRSVCEGHDPLYGAIAVERPLPTPPELIAAVGSFGTELFISNRLFEADPELAGDLARIFSGGYTEKWSTGLFFSGWAVLNPSGKGIELPLQTGSRLAQRIGLAVKKFKI